MFNQVRYRLLWSYLGVIILILGGFAIAIRLTFIHSINQRLIDEVTTLARAAATDLELKDGHSHLDDVDQFSASNQGLQWFNAEGSQLAQQGTYLLSSPPDLETPIQVEHHPHSILGVTLPVYDNQTGQLIGYVRASESLDSLHDTIHQLDWGLGGGIVVALGLTGLGGIWLIRQAMQPIEQSFQQLQQFTADASHELRSPLMVIESNTTVALSYSEGIRASDVEKFQAIASAIEQMTSLTEDLLLLAHVDRGVKSQLEAIDLTALLQQLVRGYQPQAEAKTIDLTAQISERLTIVGNAAQLTRLFSNLLENALHYTPERGIVSIRASDNGPHLLITIQDTGIGIAPEHLNLIFNRFWRVDQSRSRWAGGAGLGLAIAQSLAQSHGGKISVTSQLGKGSCFVVHLPAYEP